MPEELQLVQEKLASARGGVATLLATARQFAAEHRAVRKRLGGIEQLLKFAPGAGTELDAAAWAALAPAVQHEVLAASSSLEADLAESTAREPEPGNWIQSRQFVSAPGVLALVATAVALVLALSLAISCAWEGATGGGLPVKELEAWKAAYTTHQAAENEYARLLLDRKREGVKAQDVGTAQPAPAAGAPPAEGPKPPEGGAKPAEPSERAEAGVEPGKPTKPPKPSEVGESVETDAVLKQVVGQESTTAAKLERAAEALHPVLTSRLPSERAVLRMVLFFGALGGSLRWLVSSVQYVGNRRLRRSWVPYYVSLPFLGAGLALIMYLLLRVGVLAPVGAGSGEALANVNVLGFYGIAAMTGLFAKDALDKLGEVFRTLFKTEHEDRDSLGRGAAGGA